ncbi:MAG: hypothetical protein ABI768_00170 [Acidobacteriota bacterium]
MTDASLKFLPDLVEEHFEELAFLWGQRRGALRSPRFMPRDLARLEKRIEAHLQGLLIAGDELDAFVRPGLEGDDADAAFAAGFGLLRSRIPGSVDRVWEAFASVSGPRADGLAEAFAHGPADALLSRLQQAVTAAPPMRSVAAAEALALRGRLAPDSRAQEAWLASDEPVVRRRAWRVVSLAALPQSRALWERGLSDPDAWVRAAAREAALWCRQTWALEDVRRGRRGAGGADADSMYLVAATGDAADLERVLAWVKDVGSGPERYRVLGVLGHPAGVETLLHAMGGLDLAASAFAGQAFTKITGEDVDSGRRTVVPPADGKEPDAFEAEFLDEMPLPDERKARAAWEKRRPDAARGTRWCRGHDVSRGPSPDALAVLDRESLWEARLRGTLDGSWKGRPPDLEVFPQGAASHSAVREPY